MKPTMNLITLSGILTSLLATSIAHSAPQLPPHWVRAEQRAVYYAPVPDLQITLTRVNASEDFWELLTVELHMGKPGSIDERALLAAAYPGLALARPVIEGAESFDLRVPALGVNETIETILTPEGPYFIWNRPISKKESTRVHQIIEDLPANFFLSGKLRAWVPLVRTIERSELPATTCDALVAGDGTVYSAVEQLARLFRKIDSMRLQHDSTRESLKRSVLDRCLEVEPGVRVESFSELLRLKVTRQPGREALVGETRLKTTPVETAELRYTIRGEQR